jgi:hypothetical protein
VCCNSARYTPACRQQPAKQVLQAHLTGRRQLPSTLQRFKMSLRDAVRKEHKERSQPCAPWLSSQVVHCGNCSLATCTFHKQTLNNPGQLKSMTSAPMRWPEGLACACADKGARSGGCWKRRKTTKPAQTTITASKMQSRCAIWQLTSCRFQA